MNLVLDDVKELTRGTFDCFPCVCCSSWIDLIFPPDDEGNTSSRPLGLLVARGTLLTLISPLDGSEEIANPFVQAEEEE